MAINDNTAKWKVRKLTNLQVGSNGYWQPNEEVKVGTIRFPMGEDNIGYVLECVEAGTTGEEQPTLIGEELANYAEVGRVGQVRVIFNLAEKDVDEVMAMGITYSRLTYPELWEWAGKRAGLIISEEEWQAKFAETNGKFVPYYSSGDGSSTFRTPLLGAYLKGAETSSEVGKWLDAGLPNITGQIENIVGSSIDSGYVDTATGAFTNSIVHNSFAYDTDQGGFWRNGWLDINASKSNPIYGNSDTVTPETMTGVWVIKAVGVVVDSGETDIAKALSDLENFQSRYLPLGGGVINGELYLTKSTPDGNSTEAKKVATQGYLSMPSGYHIDIDINAQTYTAPADGWIVYMGDVTHTSSWSSVQVIGRCQDTRQYNRIDTNYSGFVPVAKGNNIQFNAAGFSFTSKAFIYAQSEV